MQGTQDRLALPPFPVAGSWLAPSGSFRCRSLRVRLDNPSELETGVKRRGTLVCSLAVLCLLFLAGPSNLLCAATESSPEAEFDQARRAYLAGRLREFNTELILLEKQLVWELQSIRNALTLPGATSVFPADEVENILSREMQGSAGAAAGIDSTSGPSAQVDNWIRVQRDDLVFRLMLAESIRGRLLGGLDEAGLNLQFRHDLRAAVVAYAHADYDLAARLLGTIRAAYPYQNMDDLLFFEAEACLAVNLYDRAGDLYRQLLRQHPDTEFRLDALRHLLFLDTYYGHFQKAQTEYSEFRSDAAAADPEIAYIMGIVAFQLNNVPRSREFLAGIPAGSSYYYRAQHLEGVCRILEGDNDAAITIFESLLQLSPGTAGRQDVSYMHEDARIKLGHLYFEKGDFAKAASMFTSIRLGSEWYDDALIGQAWSDLSLADYANAAARARDLADHLPESEYFYEARTLAGYASEKLEEKEASAADYSLVLDHAERSEQLRTLMAEQGEIRIQIRRMAELEESVFQNGDMAGWVEYQAVRDKLRQVFRRIKYTELTTANTGMTDYIDERRLILQLSEQMDRFTAPRESWDAVTTNDYLSLRERVQTLMGQVRVAGLIQIKRNPVVLRENEMQMTKAVTDSLMFSSSVELEKLAGRRAELSGPDLDRGSQVTRLEQSVLAERYANLGDRLDRWRVDAEARRAAPFSSDLPHWSNLAFSRLVLGDIRFDDLEKLDERIKELEGYIERIDTILGGGTPPAGTPAPAVTPAASPAAGTEPGLPPAGQDGESHE
jgi:tetratricopeptide (TPR) repeat protein